MSKISFIDDFNKQVLELSKLYDNHILVEKAEPLKKIDFILVDWINEYFSEFLVVSDFSLVFCQIVSDKQTFDGVSKSAYIIDTNIIKPEYKRKDIIPYFIEIIKNVYELDSIENYIGFVFRGIFDQFNECILYSNNNFSKMIYKRSYNDIKYITIEENISF